MKKPSKATAGTERMRNGNLTEEDAELWGFVTKSVARLEYGRGKRVKKSEADRHDPLPEEKVSSAHRRSAVTVQPIEPRQPPDSRSGQRHSIAPVFDRREARHIARGRIEIEARIDLHGLRQAEAHRRLFAFLRRAYDSGHRHVLVITGKGRFDDDEHTLPFHETLDRAPRGVLRRSVPMWLDEPALRDIIVSYREAAIHHGGAGALYVRLRSSSRKR